MITSTVVEEIFAIIKKQRIDIPQDIRGDARSALISFYRGIGRNMGVQIQGEKDNLHVTMNVATLSDGERLRVEGFLKSQGWVVDSMDRTRWRVVAAIVKPTEGSPGMSKESAINSGRWCHYCDCETVNVPAQDVFNAAGGYVWLCPKCRAYVKCHRDTKQAHGTVANKILRDLRAATHMRLDKLWKDDGVERGEVYTALAKLMGLQKVDCHIGKFNVDECNKTISLIPTLRKVFGLV